MKKVGILSTVNLKHMTMLSIYTNYFEERNIDYDIIYVDKYNDVEKSNAKNIYKFNLKVNREWPVHRKIKEYFKFRGYAKRVINKNEYDILIAWNSFTGLLFFDFLVSKYKKKFIFNIRDYSREKYKLIYLLIKVIVKNSIFTTISSEGFKKFLPKEDYVNIFSLNHKMLSKLNPRLALQSKESPLRISFIGYVRFFENDKKFIDALGNDPRFIIQYFGEGSEVLKAYAESKGYSNIKCVGRFESDKTPKFLLNTDIINNLYGDTTPGLKTALSIKLYYSIYMRLPILVQSGTYMDEISSRYKINITVNDIEQENLADYIYSSYHAKNMSDINDGCMEYIELINENNNEFYNKLSDVLEN